jgi:hypothetical protein
MPLPKPMLCKPDRLVQPVELVRCLVRLNVVFWTKICGPLSWLCRRYLLHATKVWDYIYRSLISVTAFYYLSFSDFLLYILCIVIGIWGIVVFINAGKYTSSSVSSIWMIIVVLVVTLSGGYAFYKYRIQVWLLQALYFCLFNNISY